MTGSPPVAALVLFRSNAAFLLPVRTLPWDEQDDDNDNESDQPPPLRDPSRERIKQHIPRYRGHGVSALYLDAGSVKRILQETAQSDRFTGPTPNTLWGHGKVDAYEALMAVRLRATS